MEHTRKAWAVQAWTYFRTIIPLLMVVIRTYALTFEEVAFHPFWLLIIPVFVLDQLVATWRAGWRARIYAALIIPLWIYEAYQSVAYWKALRLALRGGEKVSLT